MKTTALLLITLFLYGCATRPVPVERKFPEPPPSLLESCEKLKPIEENKTSIVDFLTVVVKNYNLYHQCSNKVEGWKEWYTKQKNITDKNK